MLQHLFENSGSLDTQTLYYYLPSQFHSYPRRIVSTATLLRLPLIENNESVAFCPYYAIRREEIYILSYRRNIKIVVTRRRKMPFIPPLSPHSSLWSLGVMSGTSLDGLDMALLHTDGERIIAHGAAKTVSFPQSLQQDIYSFMAGNGDALRIEHDYSQFVATEIAHFLAGCACQPDIIGWHGQTIIHRPDEGITWQMGNPALLVEHVRIPVIYDFRRRDMAAGGQGAPLVPLYHAALAHNLPHPLAIVNIGGVANVTYLGEDDVISAWDTGTGNALINDWVVRHTGEYYDADGRYAAAGKVAWERVQTAMQHPYFSAPPPKSLDRNAFTLEMVEGLSLEDGAATLTAFTVEAIASAADHFSKKAQQWVICGGGAHNATMMQMLSARLNHPVVLASTIGWRGDALEAEAFAFLAVRSLKGMVLSLPTTTGVRYAVTGGVLCQ